MHEDRVRLMHYDPRWRQEFEQTRSNLLHSCAGWVTSVEHIGSTAISGLIARPTIDVIATVQSRAGLDSASLLMEGLNFRRESSPGWAGDTRFLCKRRSASAESDATHLVLLVVEHAALWRRVIGVRELLRANPALAIDFEEAKVAKWRSGHGDLASYELAKADFFARLEDQIDL